jgi:hypothetical protein
MATFSPTSFLLSDPGFGMEKIRIRYKHPGFATTLGLAVQAHLSEEEILSQTWVSSSSMVRSISFSAKCTHRLSWISSRGN